MKTTLKFILVLFVTALTIYGCKKDTSTAPDNTTPVFHKKASAKNEYEKRWNITHFQKSLPSDTNLVFIELVLDSYILYFSDTTLIGSFSTVNDSTLNLKDYGVLTIHSVSSTNFGFSLKTVNGKMNYTSASAPTVSSSVNTMAICNTWKVISIQAYLAGIAINALQHNEVIYATFSQYGTYLTKDVVNDSISYGVNTWQWTDGNENKFCIGDWDGQNITSCNGLYIEGIKFHDNNSRCTITEVTNDSTGKYTAVIDLIVQ
jgi:hypothetical protein